VVRSWGWPPQTPPYCLYSHGAVYYRYMRLSGIRERAGAMAGVVLSIGAVFLMIPAGWLGGRCGEQSGREAEAIAKGSLAQEAGVGRSSPSDAQGKLQPPPVRDLCDD
jgi:hypothetical protein